MTFFGQLFGSGGFSLLAILFTILSLANFAQAVRLAASLRRRWAEFTTNPLQAWHKRAGEAAAFLIMVPPGVLLHELAHAVAVWVYGGQVVDVGYGFYWGYVLPSGRFTAAEDWVISVSGTVATLLYAALFWLWLRRHRSEAVQYLALRGVRFHIQYALIYYPLFTVLTFIGDWRVIYDFRATPLLSGATLALHVAILVLFWWVDRRGVFSRSAFANAAARRQFGELKEQVAQGADRSAQTAYVRQLMAQEDPGAVAAARQLTQQYPESASDQLLLAAALSQRNSRVPRAAAAAAQKAIDLGLRDLAQRAFAFGLLGRERMDRERYAEALPYFDEAVAAVSALPDRHDQGQQHHVFYQRAVAHRRLGQYEAAATDLETGRRLAKAIEATSALRTYAEEAAALRMQSGRR